MLRRRIGQPPLLALVWQRVGADVPCVLGLHVRDLAEWPQVHPHPHSEREANLAPHLQRSSDREHVLQVAQRESLQQTRSAEPKYNWGCEGLQSPQYLVAETGLLLAEALLLCRCRQVSKRAVVLRTVVALVVLRQQHRSARCPS